MRNRPLRIVLFALLIVALGFLFNLSLNQFSGEGKASPEEALPTDEQYEWIEGPKRDNEHRYFFLANGNYFGTGIVKKNLRGWSSGNGAYAPLPEQLKENNITAAYSDSKILFGLIKRNGEVKVNVNGSDASFVELTTLSEEVLKSYNVSGYSIWYIEIEPLKEKENYTIKVLDKENNVLSELTI